MPGSAWGPRLATTLVVLLLVGFAAGGSLWLKQSAENVIQAEAAVTAVIAEARLQDGLEWRAISGQPPPDLRQQLADSRARVSSLLDSAQADGLAESTARRLDTLQSGYLADVDRELDLLDQGRIEKAAEWDETEVDVAADEYLEGLQAAAAGLRAQGAPLSRWSDLGLAFIVLFALATMAVLQRRLLRDRQRFEDELLGEARYRALIDRSRDLVVVVDRSGRLRYLSPAAQRVLGGGEAAKQPRLSELVVPEDRDRLDTLLHDAVAETEPPPVDLRFAGAATERPTVFQFSARDLTGDPLVGGIVLTGRDVTRDRELDEAKDDFVSTVSHELRTPLTSIQGYLELLRTGEFGEVNTRQVGALEVIDRNASRLLSLIHELLFLSGIDSRVSSSPTERFDMAALVEAAVSEARTLAAAHEIELRRSPCGVPAWVEGDPEGMQRVVSNLLTNALKFSPAGGRVVVTVDLGGDTARLSVADQGIGISAEDRDKIFTRFFRAASARTSAIPGTGLGLAVCRSVVEEHGGSISVQSEAGVGSEFTVSVPLLRESTEVAAR